MILNRYILSQILKTTVSITLIMCLLISMIESLQLLELLVSNSITVGQFLMLIVLLTPKYIANILPLTLFAAVTITYLKISHNREIVALRSIGINNATLMRPAIYAGIIITLFSFLLNTTITPIGFNKFKIIKHQANQNLVTGSIPQSKFITLGENSTLFVRRISGLTIYDILLYRKNKDSVQILTAKKGGLVAKKDATQIILYNGLLQTGRHRDAKILAFDQYIISIEYPNSRYQGKSDINEYTSFELGEKIQNGTASHSDVIFFYNRIILSILPLITSILAGIAILINKYSRHQSIQPSIIAVGLTLVFVVLITIITKKATENKVYIYYAFGAYAIALFLLLFRIFVSDKRKL